MKGFAEEITWTAIVLIAAVISVIILFSLLVYYRLPIVGGKSLSYSVVFVDLVNRPYLVASAVGNAKFYDRILFEHALQAAVVESLENSNSQAVPQLVEEYMEFYDLKFYSISVKKEGSKIFEITNKPKTCGVDLFCVPKIYRTEAGTCNVGRVETDGKCDSGYVCCKEDKSEYENNPEKFKVVFCGEKGVGVCSAKAEDVNQFNAKYIKKFPCGSGQVEVKDATKNCEKVNNGKTPICCEPFDVGIISVGRAYNAEIPLLYKDELAMLEVLVE